MSNNFDDLNKEQLIEYIHELKRELNNGKYGLFFDRKLFREDIVEKTKNSIPLLERVLDYDVEFGNKNHLLIEGDNFHVLSALNLINETDGMIDIITIDPPYNTGNDEFTFKDGFKHTEWLSFMEKRLHLAKELLKETGIIYINIDHNEYSNLKLLCDRIFGSHNLLSSFIWVNNTKGRQISNGGAVKTYEHILLYAKNASLIDTFEGDIRELAKEMPLFYKNQNYVVFKDKKGQYVIKNQLYNTNSIFNEETRPNLVFNIFYNEKSGNVLFGDVDDNNFEQTLDSDFVKIAPNTNNNGTHKYHAWRWSKNKILEEIEDLHFEKQNGTYKIFTKIRNIYMTNLKDILSNSTNGNIELGKIIGKGKFSFPKPVVLIKRLIKSYVNKEYNEELDEFTEVDTPIFVLDFFAGSGTTGQAVLELNKEDGKERIVILNTLNEVSDKVLVDYLRTKGVLSKRSTKRELNEYKESNDYKKFILTNEYSELGICKAVTRERMLRIVSGTALEGPYSSEGIPANFRYFRTSFLNDVNNRDQAKYNLVQKCDSLLCIKEHVYEKVESAESFNIYIRHDQKAMAIFNDYFEEKSFLSMIEKLKNINIDNVIIYYFSLDNTIDENLEKLALEHIENSVVKPIPSKIYEVYKKNTDGLRRNY